MRRGALLFAAVLVLFALPHVVEAQSAAVGQVPPQFEMTVGGGGKEGLHVSGAVGAVLAMGIMALLPSLVLLMTSFTRIIIVLHLLRQAIGTASAPPTMVLGALALLLTGFVMTPTIQRANETALQPYLAGEITQGQAFETGIIPFREFMHRHTREEDLGLFLEMGGRPAELASNLDEVPTVVLMSAFVTSELKTAFFLGFVIFLPFLVIDLIVASVLLGLGVFMLPPALVSLPFKLLLFVLADGWFLLVSSLVQGFHP